MSRTVQPMSPITLEKVRNARMAGCFAKAADDTLPILPP